MTRKILLHVQYKHNSFFKYFQSAIGWICRSRSQVHDNSWDPEPQYLVIFQKSDPILQKAFGLNRASLITSTVHMWEDYPEFTQNYQLDSKKKKEKTSNVTCIYCGIRSEVGARKTFKSSARPLYCILETVDRHCQWRDNEQKCP